MTSGAGGIDTKMEVCPLSSEVHPSVHSTILHLHAWATISLPCATIYHHDSLCRTHSWPSLLSLVSQFTRHYILHHTSPLMSHLMFNLRVTQTLTILQQFPHSYQLAISYKFLVSLDTWMVLTRSRSQQANQNGSGQRHTDKELKPSTNTNGNGHDSRNHHLHPSLQHPTKSQEQETAAHHHPSFQPYCKHSEADGDLHSHALGAFTSIYFRIKLMNRSHGARVRGSDGCRDQEWTRGCSGLST